MNLIINRLVLMPLAARLLAYGSWLMAQGSWLMAQGSRLEAQVSRLKAHGSRAFLGREPRAFSNASCTIRNHSMNKSYVILSFVSVE